MSLARGEGLARGRSQDGSDSLLGAPSVVIAIASSIEERSRLANALDGGSVVLLVSSPAEALEVLHGAVDTPTEQMSAPASLAAAGAPCDPTRVDVARPDSTLHPPGREGPVSVVAMHGTPDLEVDSDWRVARRADREVRLTPLEHDLLICLLEQVGHIETFESLQRRVWGNDHLGDRSHVQSVVKRLRRKLDGLDSSLRIEAVRGVGLRLVDTASSRSHSRAPGTGHRVARH